MRVIPVLTFVLAAGLVASAVPEARAEVATPEEMELVCRNWLSYMVHQTGNWAGVTEPKIVDVQEIAVGDMVLARCYSIAPRGNVVVPVLKELPPIKAYSEVYDLDVDQAGGFPQLLREVLEHRTRLFIKEYGSLEASQPRAGDVLFDPMNRREWDRFLAGGDDFKAALRDGALDPLTQVGPLLTTIWHQDWPYYNDCPMGDGGRTLVGCVATAMAQIMRYHEWPPEGVRSHAYWWGGDDSCGDSTPGDHLYASFADAYDWANMPNHCYGGCSQDQQNALAELCYEVGVAFDMDYGACGSGAIPERAVLMWPKHFRYHDAIDREDRNDHSARSWFGLIQWEINSQRPILYTIWGHAIVCDGWRDTGGQRQYHMNYGWGGSSFTTWYVLDQLAYSPDPMQEYMIRLIAPDVCEDVITSYDVYLDTHDPPMTLVCEGLTAPDCDPGPLEMETTYFWQVIARTGTEATMGAVWSFTTEGDCNDNGIPDSGDISGGTSLDCQLNGIPDECDLSGDGNGDGVVGVADFGGLATCLTDPCVNPPCDPPLYANPCCAIPDFDDDGDVDLVDFSAFEQAIAD